VRPAGLLVVAALACLSGTPGGGALAGAHPEPGDRDGDQIQDVNDNCPDTPNGAQANRDGDELGDACDADDDGDGVPDDSDNCRVVANPGQENANQDAYGDACPPVDTDADGRVDSDDNCTTTANPDQADLDGDDKGDSCDRDADGDRYDDWYGVDSRYDNCPRTYNPDQADADKDGIGTACDPQEPIGGGGSSGGGAGGGSAGGGGGGGGSAGPAAGAGSTTALRVSLGARAAMARLDGPLVVTVRCSEACGLEVAVELDARTARRLHAPRRLAAGTWALGGPGKAYVFCDWRDSARRALRRKGAVSARLVVTARDAAGNARTARRSLRVGR
jgi:hypothetical protein